MQCREEKLKDLRENTPTIFAPNCWGGLTYHHLGLQFKSPLINLFIHHDDYLRFLLNPQFYMAQEMTLKEMYSDEYYKKPFPVGLIGDISLWMNHVDTFEKGKADWDRRKERIDWDNLFVMLFEENPELVKKFLELPYEKKVCFVPWPTDEPGLIYVPWREKENLRKRYEMWEMMNNIALGHFVLYDDVELLHDCKYVQIGNIIRE